MTFQTYNKKLNGTPAIGRNEMIRNSKSKYILFMDGDDNFICTLKELVEELRYKDYDYIISSVRKIFNDGKIIDSPFIYDKKLFSCSESTFDKIKQKLIAKSALDLNKTTISLIFLIQKSCTV